MSGIVGVWNLDGRPLDEAVLSKMGASIRHHGRDGESHRVSGPVGFAHQHLWVTCEEMGEIQPLVTQTGVMLAMDGRLDNRDELLPVLELPASISDAACVLATYERWEEHCVDRLNGDFSLAVFDAPKQRLLLARDSIGIRSLYYCRRDRLFAFASEIKALLAHPDIYALPDDEGIADFLLVASRPVDRPEVTCFAGISALVPAHVAVITPERTVTRRYWDFDVGRAIRFRSLDEYAEAYRERLTEAVRRRIRSAYPVAISVSGGLDSSSILCQAETLRRAGRGHGPEIVGLSYLGAEGSAADERQYLVEIEREYGIDIERFAAEPSLHIMRDVEEQVRSAEAPFLDLMWGISRSLHERAVERGARVLLTGHWGDQVLFSSAYLIDLFHRLAWGEIRRHLQQYERWFGTAEARTLSRRFVIDLARHHVPRSLAPPLKWVRRRLFGVERPKPWFSDAFLRRSLRFAGQLATLGGGFHSAQARATYLEARSKYHVHCMEYNHKSAAQYGLAAAFPFLDRDLLAFLMAIPGEVQSRDGVPRALAREAMRGVLPEAVRLRTGKADFTTMINEAVARDVPAIVHALSGRSLGVQLGYLDAGRLGPAVAGLAAGLTGPESLDSWDLIDIVGLEAWLRLFWPERQHARPESCLLQEMSNEPKEGPAFSAGEAPVSRASPQDPR